MEFTDREVLVTVVERLRAIETKQRADGQLLLQIAHAFRSVHTDNQKAFDQFEGLAKQLSAEDHPGDLDLVYGDILQRLKVSKDHVE